LRTLHDVRLYEAIIVKLIFDLFHLLVRPAGDYLVVPT
jgi:hypothetical protein